MNLPHILSGAGIALLAALIGAGLLAGGVFLGYFLFRNNEPTRKKSRRRGRRPSDVPVLDPAPGPVSDPTGAFPGQTAGPGGWRVLENPTPEMLAELFGPGAVVSRPDQPPPGQEQPPVAREERPKPVPPPVDKSLEQVIRNHGLAIQAWERGDQSRAVFFMNKAIQANRRVRNNPWLDAELYGEVISLLCATGNFNQASMFREGLMQARGWLEANAPDTKSNYFGANRLGDLSWMEKAFDHDVDRNEETFYLLKESQAALENEDADVAFEFADRAVAEAIKNAGPNHWITALALHGLAQACVGRKDFHAAKKHWKKAEALLEEWPNYQQGLIGTVRHNLRQCEQMTEGEEWNS